jgi:hypothetical protein
MGYAKGRLPLRSGPMSPTDCSRPCEVRLAASPSPRRPVVLMSTTLDAIDTEGGNRSFGPECDDVTGADKDFHLIHRFSWDHRY